MAVRTARNVSLTPELEDWATKQVATGRYRTVSELVRAALRLLQENQSPEAAAPAPRRHPRPESR